uniref:AsmA_2 domain-containing protein n=1 Tax=Macrostomum lignano TaxID=282301 RepID=A0A1I8JMY9_9PLAT
MSNQFDTFDIQLAKDGPHLSGDALKGDLLLKTKKDLSFARIVVHLYGGGRVEIDASGTATQAAQPWLTGATLAKASCLSLPVTVIGRVDLNLQPGGGDGGQLWQPIEVWGHWQQSTSRPLQSLSSGQRLKTAWASATVRLLAAHRRRTGFAIGDDAGGSGRRGAQAARKEHRTAVADLPAKQERLKPAPRCWRDAVQADCAVGGHQRLCCHAAHD